MSAGTGDTSLPCHHLSGEIEIPGKSRKERTVEKVSRMARILQSQIAMAVISLKHKRQHRSARHSSSRPVPPSDPGRRNCDALH
ncbi:hypothetical protein DPEC_G00164950 [Dallia pectoralis]|uniref:Uncharacterized protein n=1 Tax=Dallia pectoralis TaxID=75939 RepID=A0ACC2GHK8_DALPE|nr:hypothetical protein DPEC_G00164950 [Dallia pectoralis]